MDNRYETGRVYQDHDISDIFYQTVSETLKWDKEEELVQLVKVTQLWKNENNEDEIRTIGYQLVEMRISGNMPHLVLTTSFEVEAVQMYLHLTFGL